MAFYLGLLALPRTNAKVDLVVIVAVVERMKRDIDALLAEAQVAPPPQ